MCFNQEEPTNDIYNLNRNSLWMFLTFLQIWKNCKNIVKFLWTLLEQKIFVNWTFFIAQKENFLLTLNDSINSSIFILSYDLCFYVCTFSQALKHFIVLILWMVLLRLTRVAHFFLLKGLNIKFIAEQCLVGLKERTLHSLNILCDT